MDAKWLLGRANESVVAIGCCVKWAGPNMRSVLGSLFYWCGCVSIPILSLLMWSETLVFLQDRFQTNRIWSRSWSGSHRIVFGLWSVLRILIVFRNYTGRSPGQAEGLAGCGYSKIARARAYYLYCMRLLLLTSLQIWPVTKVLSDPLYWTIVITVKILYSGVLDR